MTIFKGDRVIRVDGTAVGFRRNETFEAFDVSRTHIKVKNANGLISKWFERKDFVLMQERTRRETSYVIVYKTRDVIKTTVRNDRRQADDCIRDILAAYGADSVLAKKKVTIPYQLIGVGL